jgi:hypothetical protein
VIVVAYVVAAVFFAVGMYLIVTGRRNHRRGPDLTERLMRHRPVADQARQWLDQRERHDRAD